MPLFAREQKISVNLHIARLQSAGKFECRGKKTREMTENRRFSDPWHWVASVEPARRRMTEKGNSGGASTLTLTTLQPVAPRPGSKDTQLSLLLCRPAHFLSFSPCSLFSPLCCYRHLVTLFPSLIARIYRALSKTWDSFGVWSFNERGRWRTVIQFLI